MTDAIRQNGLGHYDHKAIDARFGDLPRSSRERWRKAVERRLAPGEAARYAGRNDYGLPNPPTVADVAGGGIPPVHDVVARAIEHGEQVVRLCTSGEGRLRNPKLLLAGSKHMLEALRTAAAVSAAVNDAEQLRRFMQAIIDHVKRRDPEVADAILADIADLARNWGIR